MKADVGPDRVSPLSSSRNYSSKRCATHSVKERAIVCVISRFFAPAVPHRRLVRAGLRDSFNESMEETCA
jgi:hypothetical protein